jgi:hypothetical protein
VLGEGLLTSVYVGVVLYGAVIIAGPIVPAVLGSEPLANLQVISRYRDAIETFLERAIDWTAIGLWAYVSLDRLISRIILDRCVG